MLYLATSRSNLAERGQLNPVQKAFQLLIGPRRKQEAGNKHKITGSLPVISSSLLLIDEHEIENKLSTALGSRHDGGEQRGGEAAWGTELGVESRDSKAKRAALKFLIRIQQRLCLGRHRACHSRLVLSLILAARHLAGAPRAESAPRGWSTVGGRWPQ